MSEQAHGSAGTSLPDAANLDWLRKQAKRRLAELRNANPDAQLADAQFELAKEYGFSSWRALKAHIDSRTLEGQLFEAAEKGDAAKLGALLDANPELLHIRRPPYAQTLLHAAAKQLATVDLLLRRGMDPNVKEKGDDTYAMHWAAAAGNLDVVRRLADAGGDVVGHGDDHGLEVIGWASCWEGCDDDAHRAVQDFLVSRGARHHIFSAIATNRADEVRRIVASDPLRAQQPHEPQRGDQVPLHFAIRMNRPDMVRLLLDLGADPLATDADGDYFPNYATSPDVDRAAMEAVRALTNAELLSAERGHRPPRAGKMDLMALVSLRDYTNAERILSANPPLIDSGALHIMAKRGDADAVRWLLAHGANANVPYTHGDAVVRPLHLAAWGGSGEITRMLLDAGADPTIRDSKHEGDAMDWAQHFGRPEVVRVLREPSGAEALRRLAERSRVC